MAVIIDADHLLHVGNLSSPGQGLGMSTVWLHLLEQTVSPNTYR